MLTSWGLGEEKSTCIQEGRFRAGGACRDDKAAGIGREELNSAIDVSVATQKNASQKIILECL